METAVDRYPSGGWPTVVGAPAQVRDDLDRVMRDSRQRFVATFEGHCHSLAAFAGTPAAERPAEAAIAVLHRIAGMGGTVGFNLVSTRAAELEDALRGHTLAVVNLPAAVDSLRKAFAHDVAEPLKEIGPTVSAAAPATVLLVEDEPVQRAVISAQLRKAGYVPVEASSGEEGVALARQARPAAILLDVELPGMSGHAVCRLIKADPSLAAIPVAFLSAHAALDDRLAGLSFGADDFLTKPIDPRELALRMQLLCKRQLEVESTGGQDVLTYDAFCALARELLARGAATLALIRTPAERADDVASCVRDEIRRRDLCGHYDRNHLLVLLPETGAPATCDRIAGVVERCRGNGMNGVYAGIAASSFAGARALGQLLEEADEALAIARYEDRPAAIRPEGPRTTPTTQAAPAMVVVGDDDPDVVRIVDAHLAASGYRRALAFDGFRTLEEVRTQRPDVLVVDLMMPRMTGFDVLAGLRGLGETRPRVIVLSARGREEDVIRAFSLGADDFMTKPFNPQELLARIARLLK